MSGIMGAALPLAGHLGRRLPRWLQSPNWFHSLSHPLGLFILHHSALGLFTVIFSEELGIPLPVPGDVAIAVGGYLTTRGQLGYWQAYLSVLGGAMVGSLCLFGLSRTFGRPFILNLAKYLGIDPSRIDRAEQAFRRWGHWAIIVGRLVPGMRIWMTALSGVLNVRLRVFLPSVLVSSIIWAGVFIELGRRLGRRTLALLGLVPAHLLPWLALLVAGLLIGHLAWQRRRPRGAALRRNHKLVQGLDRGRAKS